MTLKGTVNEITFHSKLLSEEIPLLIYLPATFSFLYKYNVLIAQDGQDYFSLGKIGRVTEELLHKQEIDNTIIVGIPYQSKEDRWDKYHPNGKKHQSYIRFLGEELVPFIDREYPTYQMGLGRVLLGDSLGATISLLTALEYPHTFGKVIMQSPYIDDNVHNKLSEFKDVHLLELYQIIGKEETKVETTHGEIKDFLTPNRMLRDTILENGFSSFYEEFDGNHTWTYWQPDLPRALGYMLKNY